MKRVLAIWLPNFPPRRWRDDNEPGVLKRLAQWCHRYSPCTGFEANESTPTLLLDATNLASTYGSEAAFVEQTRRGLLSLQLRGRGALASTIGAAWAVARYGDECDAARWPIVPAEETIVALAPLPTAALRLEAELIETLRNLGVERVAELLALPRDQLRSRFGPSLLMRIDQALGTLSETFVAVDPPPEFVVEQLLEHPLAKLESLRTVVALLTQRLARHLAARCAGALRIACRFRCEGSGAVEFEAGWFEPTANSSHLQEIIDLEMERLQLPAPATAVVIVVLRYALLAERQGTLFGEERRLGSSQPLAALVDRLVGRLGAQRVVRHRLQPEAQPELAFRKVPLISGKRRRSRPASDSVTRTIGALDRPLFLLRRPLPLDVMAMLHEGPPERFRRAGEVHHVLRYTGPERIETGWWRGNPLWRDYFRVETAAARRFWIFRRWPDGRWFLHGVFG